MRGIAIGTSQLHIQKLLCLNSQILKPSRDKGKWIWFINTIESDLLIHVNVKTLLAMKKVCFNVGLVFCHQITCSLLKVILHCVLGSGSDISNVFFLDEASTLCIFCLIIENNKKPNKKAHLSCFILNDFSALGGQILEITDFKTYMVLFLQFVLCFLYTEN